jgi:hypothetical protein
MMLKGLELQLQWAPWLAALFTSHHACGPCVCITESGELCGHLETQPQLPVIPEGDMASPWQQYSAADFGDDHVPAQVWIC